jgi:hypothetical protein
MSLAGLDTEVTFPGADKTVSISCEQVVVGKTDTDQHVILGFLNLFNKFILP